MTSSYIKQQIQIKWLKNTRKGTRHDFVSKDDLDYWAKFHHFDFKVVEEVLELRKKYEYVHNDRKRCFGYIGLKLRPTRCDKRSIATQTDLADNEEDKDEVAAKRRHVVIEIATPKEGFEVNLQNPATSNKVSTVPRMEEVGYARVQPLCLCPNVPRSTPLTEIEQLKRVLEEWNVEDDAIALHALDSDSDSDSDFEAIGNLLRQIAEE